MGNFMINTQAKEGESMVTAIDNDMILGMDTSERHAGHQSSSEALLGINDRAKMDFGSSVKTTFPMMTKEIKEILKNLDLEKFNEILMPYADRVSRKAIIHRAQELKALAESVPVCDLSTEEGIQIYMHRMIRSSMAEWIRVMAYNFSGSLINAGSRDIPNTIIQMIVESYQMIKWSWGSPKETIKIMKKLGLSKEETEAIFLENYVGRQDTDKVCTREELMASPFGPILEDYDNL